jgi:predicted permease
LTFGEFWRRIRFAFKSDRFERDLEEEMQLHAELRAEKLRHVGVPAEDAAKAAQRQFGNTTLLLEDSRSEWSFTWLESWLQDMRYAIRTFRRAPLFTCGVAATIGMGLGLICSLFTIFNAYVLRPFVVRDPHSLFAFSWFTKAGWRQGFSWAEVEHLRSDHSVFSEVLVTADASMFLEGRALPGRLVTGNYFSMLGVQAALGRTLLHEDAAVPGAEAVVALSHQAWKSRFGGDPNIVGKKIAIRGHTYEVVGVARPEFAGLDGSTFKEPSPDFWAPITMAKHFYTTDLLRPDERDNLSVVGRLKPEVSEQQAKAALEIYARHATAELPEAERPVRFFFESRATAIPLTPPLLAAFSVVLTIFGMVLLIACANVANMMLARSMARQREIGVRLSLGAARGRLVRQLLTEAILLSLPGAAFGLALAWIAARFGPRFVLSRLLAPEFASVMRIPSLDPDIRVFLFVLGAALSAAILFGLAPAIQATRTSLSNVAKGDFGNDLRPGRLRNVLVVTQVTVCVLFLVSAGVLLRGSRQLAERDTGMDLDRVANVDIPKQSRARILERLTGEPWVEKIATAWRAPLYGELRTVNVLPSGSKDEVRAGYNFVSPEYFEVFGIPLKRGRNFTRQENDSEAAVVIVSEATARCLWPNQEAIGQSIRIGRDDAVKRGNVQVIGVAGDAISGWIHDGIDRTCLYFPIGSRPGRRTDLMRVRGGLPAARRQFAIAVESVAPTSEWHFVPMEEVAFTSLSPFRAASLVAWILGGLALILTLSGIYGVLSYLVSQRTKEIGIRMALGASASAVLRSVLAQSFKLTALGAMMGVLAALGLSHYMAARVEMINTFDWTAYLGGVTLILFAALAAGYIPSRRAARVDPAVTLRAD